MPKMSAAEKAAVQAEVRAELAAEDGAVADAVAGPGEIVEEYVDADGFHVGVTAEGDHVELDLGEGAAPAETPDQIGHLAPGFEFAMVPVGQLREHPKNANRGDVAAIGQSVKESGFYGAVVAQLSTGYILAGNHRYRVAVSQGLSEVPVTWVDVDAVGAIRIMLADNETARRGSMDLGAQDALIQELREVDPELKGTGFDSVLDEIAEAERESEREAEPVDDEDGSEPEYPDFGAKYGVIVMCTSEAHQVQVYEQLEALGLGELRVVAV